jgi:hypothetical protein
MKETPFGAVLANVLSVGTRGLGWFLWYFLRLIYRGEPRVIAGFVGAGLVIAGLIWAIAR